MAALAPITPALVARYGECIGVETIDWSIASLSFVPDKVSANVRLLDRLDPKLPIAMEEQSVEEATQAQLGDRDDIVRVDSFKDEIEFADFAKIDLRVGVVESAEFVKGANKLLQLQVFAGRSLTIFSGVRSVYPDPSVLVGKRVLVVANLKPRKMRFGVSEGMLLSMAGPDDEGLQLLTLDESGKGGWEVS